MCATRRFPIATRAPISGSAAVGAAQSRPRRPICARCWCATSTTGNTASAGLITSGHLRRSDVQRRRHAARLPRWHARSRRIPPTTPFPAQMIGGEDGVGPVRHRRGHHPLERISTFGRATYDFGERAAVGGRELWPLAFQV